VYRQIHFFTKTTTCIYLYLFINCNWIVTRWQYTFTHKQYMYMYIYIYMCVCVCLCVYIHTHTHIVKCSAKVWPLRKEILIKRAEIVSKTAGVFSYRNAANHRVTSLYLSHYCYDIHPQSTQIYVYVETYNTTPSTCFKIFNCRAYNCHAIGPYI
jgi:hypothetical protein